MRRELTIYSLILLIISAFLFTKPQRSEEEMREFILSAQINYPLPEKTIGRPVSVEDENGLRGLSVLRKSGEFKEKSLKIIQRDGKFYWDSWKGQRLIAVRGRSSTVFMSKENDGHILINNGNFLPEFIKKKIIPLMICMPSGCHIGRCGSEYVEIRAPLNEKTVVINGTILSKYYPSGFKEKLCEGRNIFYPPNLYYKPSIYEQIIRYLYKK